MGMELAVITDEIDNDLGRALEVMAEYDVRGAELRTVWDKNIADAPREYWQRAKDLLAERGMHVVGIASPFYKCDMPGIDIEGPAGPLHSATARGLGDQIALLEHCIDIARFFDTNLIRVFSFWKHGPLTPAIEERIVDAFAEPVALAEREGIVLGLENEHACCLGTGAQTARVLAEINSPALRAIWDPGNAFMDGEEPFPRGYEAIKEFIAHVHIKDAAVPPGATEPDWTLVGGGQIDYSGQMAALRADGYPGYLSLETHWVGPDGKEVSSRACLEALQKLAAA
jgi:sugar phosphate isomerase/epimerase